MNKVHFLRRVCIILFATFATWGSGSAQAFVATSNLKMLWPQGRIPYAFAGVLQQNDARTVRDRNIILNAMAQFNVTQKIRFVKATAADKNVLTFTAGFTQGHTDDYFTMLYSGCGGGQFYGYCGPTTPTTFYIDFTKWNPDTAMGPLLFNLGYVIGLLPEHYHPQRAQYFNLHLENEDAGCDPFLTFTVGPQYFTGNVYDVFSIMQAPPNYCSKAANLLTITLKDGSSSFGYTQHLSNEDVFWINGLYNSL